MFFWLGGIINVRFSCRELITHIFSGLTSSIKSPCASEKLPLCRYLCCFFVIFFFLTCPFKGKEGESEGLQWCMGGAGSPAIKWGGTGDVGAVHPSSRPCSPG